MTDAERAQHTPAKDDPIQWPDELKPDQRPKSTLAAKVRLAVMLVANFIAVMLIAYVISHSGWTLQRVAAGLLVAYTTVMVYLCWALTPGARRR